MTLDEWRLVGDNGKGKAYVPNASGKTAQAVNAGVDARYKALVETAMGEGKTVPGFVREQSVFTGGVSKTAGPRYPLTKTEFDAKFNAGERLTNGEITPAKQTRPLTQSEYNAMIGERPAQAAPRSTKEPLPVPETAGGRSVEGRSVEGIARGKTEQPVTVGEKVREGNVPVRDRFKEELLEEAGKNGERGEYSLEEISGDTFSNELIGPVEFYPPKTASTAEIEQVKLYVGRCMDALKNAYLSETGRVSTSGALRAEASKAARIERQRALKAGTPYIGHVGHAPDTTWTGQANPPYWLDLSPAINESLGAQASKYPIGYKPTEFIFRERK